MLLTVTFMVEVPAPVIELGVKVMVTPRPSPEADKAIAELKPPVTVVAIVEVPELPCAILSEVGDALSEKPGGTEVTIRETVVVSAVPLAGVPVTVIG